MATNLDHQSYGVKCEPDVALQCDFFQPALGFLPEGSQEANASMDLSSFLEMDDRVLSGECTHTAHNIVFPRIARVHISYWAHADQ